MIRASAICWIAISLFLALQFALPNPYRWLLWIPCGIALPYAVIHWNRRQQAIRQAESRGNPQDPSR